MRTQEAPPYSPASATSTEGGEGLTPALAPPTQPINFFSIVHGIGAIKGNYTIDPSLSIPTSLLPPLAEGQTEEDRENLRLETRNGSIDVHVFLVNDKAVDTKGGETKPTTINICSNLGAVFAKIVSAFIVLLRNARAYLWIST